ncbi:hypothetical protein MTR67_026476 [Solanum verrucosum]|uniref:Peptidase S8/S53 domain-containing protein n=1 Tax=Solanum verrucosum TaxID=315347 RepID=A0AAF0R0K8_SOLVR|nr:hypothetical protein MTR67_026476 [Solanum verrucosum]
MSGNVAEINDEKAMFKSARDNNGHGCHTTSTAAGHYVAGMNYKGLTSRRDSGSSPVTWITVYKICWSSCCDDVDLLAAFDDAIKDGVHSISLSLVKVLAYLKCVHLQESDMLLKPMMVISLPINPDEAEEKGAQKATGICTTSTDTLIRKVEWSVDDILLRSFMSPGLIQSVTPQALTSCMRSCVLWLRLRACELFTVF